MAKKKELKGTVLEDQDRKPIDDGATAPMQEAEEHALARKAEEEERLAAHEKVMAEIAANHEKADAHAKKFRDEIHPKEIEKARQVVDHEEFLKANGYEHIRQPNEIGDEEDYSAIDTTVEAVHNDDPKKRYDEGVVEITAATTPHGRALEIGELTDPSPSPEIERLADRPEE